MEAQFITFLIGRLEALTAELGDDSKKADIQLHIKELKSVVKSAFDKKGA